MMGNNVSLSKKLMVVSSIISLVMPTMCKGAKLVAKQMSKQISKMFGYVKYG